MAECAQNEGHCLPLLVIWALALKEKRQPWTASCYAHRDLEVLRLGRIKHILTQTFTESTVLVMTDLEVQKTTYGLLTSVQLKSKGQCAKSKS